MESPERELELRGDALRDLVGAALERIVRHIDTLPAQPASDLDGAEAVAAAFDEPLPEAGAPAEALLDRIFGAAVTKGFNTAGPGYLAYIPGGGLPHAAVADLVAGAVNRYVGVYTVAPALARIEATVIRWLRDLAGFPAGASGYLATGGSLANFSAVVTARAERLPEDFLRGTLYVSDQGHHSIAKAARLAGFPAERVRAVESDERSRVRLDRLQAAVDEDRRRGLEPFLVVGNAGTTNTGAVDDLGALADLAARERLWFHVDAAYGGCFLLTERGRRALAGIERADTVVLDPHKGLFLPYGTGAILARDGRALARAHGGAAEYLPSLGDDPERIDFCRISPELSRGFRGLRVWLPLMMHGAQAFRRALDEKLDLARLACAELRRLDGLEIVAGPELSVVAFRLAPRPDLGLVADALDAANERLLAAVNARRRVFLSGTRLRGRFTLRICVLSFRTHEDRVHAALDDIRASIPAALGASYPPTAPPESTFR